MRTGRLFLVSLAVILGVGIVVHGFWRTIILGTGAWFLCWGLLGTRLRWPSTVAGAIVTGFGVGLYDGHPFLTALLGAVLALLLWPALRTRRLS
jgi:hypothetical protein